jgi:hypothetical protein
MRGCEVTHSACNVSMCERILEGDETEKDQTMH